MNAWGQSGCTSTLPAGGRCRGSVKATPVAQAGYLEARSISVQTYSTLSELGAQTNCESADLVVLSLLEASREACASALKDLPEFASGHPVIALASTNDPGLAFAAIHCGAKGFIPMTMGFEITIEVMRFILAGGTYVPPNCLLAPDQLGLPAPTTPSRLNILTGRELSVVQAIKQGKSNKIIAHELNMGLSTVKSPFAQCHTKSHGL